MHHSASELDHSSRERADTEREQNADPEDSHDTQSLRLVGGNGQRVKPCPRGTGSNNTTSEEVSPLRPLETSADSVTAGF